MFLGGFKMLELKDLIIHALKYSICKDIHLKSEEKTLILKFINELNTYVQLRDLQKLTDVAKIYDVDRRLLDYRLKFLDENIDYKKLGNRQPTILTPSGVEKILNLKEVEV
jgi:hypothetical protein